MAEEEEILFVGFNQDATSLAVGTHRGYSLFSLKAAADILEKEHDSTEVEDTCLMDRLFLSSLITVVSLNAPRKLRVFHFQKQTEICSHSYSNTILAVKLNRLRVVVCLEESLYIHNIRDMKVLHTIRDTPANSQGLCQLASSDISYLAYPGSSHTGEVHVFDAANLQLVATIIAHDSPLAAIKFNADGSKLATASQKGTVIRVFSVPQGDRLFEFRRGMKRCVSISCLNFSADSLFLCASSNTETVHVFKLDQHSDAQQQRTPSETPSSSQQQPAAQAGWMDFVKGTAVTYLPTHMTDILQQDRAFATAKLPSISAKNTVALAMIGKVLRLLVASTDGYVYIYDVDRVHGGECSLVKQHKFTGSIGAAGSSPGGGSSYATAVRPQDGNTPIEEKIETAAGAVGSGHIDDYDEDFPPMSHNAD